MRYPSGMRRALRLALVGLLGIHVLAGCLPAPAGPGSGGSGVDPTVHPSDLPMTPPGLHPQVVFTDLTVLPGDTKGEWLVLGLARNDSRYALEAVFVAVELLDPAGSPDAAATVQLPVSVLVPGATSPFVAEIEQVLSPDGARASLEAFRFSTEAPVRVSLEAVHTTRSPEGIRVLGEVRNRDSRPIYVRDVIVAWRDANRVLAGLTIASVPAARVPDGGSLPWMAEAPGATLQSHFEIFAAASVVDEASEVPLESAIGPAWRVTAQGRGFVSGAIRNAGDEPALPEVAIAVSAAGRLIGLEIQRSSIPLQPGETLAFGADRFAGLEAIPGTPAAGADDITLELFLAGRRVPSETPTAVILPVSIQQFEVIGSGVFLRGALNNPGPGPLKSAMVFVSLRSTTGALQTARWLELTPPSPGESMQFSVDMPLAIGDDPAMSEFDVRALGVPLPESSW